MRHVTSVLYFVLLLCQAITLLDADEHDHVYKDGEEVVLWMNNVGPYSNRQETYTYFSLPFCRGYKTTIEHYHETLGEALLGVELEYSGLDIRFKVNQEKTEYCKQTLTTTDATSLAFAVSHNYWYQMYIDDLPLWALVGEVEGDKNLIYTHKKFEIGYNQQQIIDVNIIAEEKKEIHPNQELIFTYEIIWKPSTVPFDKRFEKYLDPSFFQHRIHWFSIFNSFMMVIFLVGLVWMILLRTLNKDYARYQKETIDIEMDDIDLPDDYGWKQVHGDVFRTPQYPLIFSSLIGTGYHLLGCLFITIGLAILAEFYTERGSLLSATIFIYALCSPINGYFGGGMYSRVGGRNWIKQIFMGALLFPTVISIVALSVNAIAIYYHAARAIPFTTMLAIVCICIFVILPLAFLGTIVGRNLKGTADVPCRINVVPRPIPDKKWFLEPASIAIAAGFLPFGSIFIEMYFIFTSFWAYKIYYVYGFMLLVACILIVVTACVTIVATYFLLNAEDYRWRWSSFCAGGSVSIYIYFYAMYYYFFKTKMYGFFQTSFYFGYMGVFSVGLGLLCGTVGYVSAAVFIHKIYSRIKLD
ncbi:endomembrane protein 70 domain-containing protein [Ditylenchus destructor]|uniref:Transmembrane 9 superfamily member n=1 Tax=Ditylenchus destructor TaxID=166010 RepID=A0AAD4R1B2_9BILA|nr:endomembrane protein 70 domain-containing protein [Ditylenchus destructor]